jgi:hypothetical protein
VPQPTLSPELAARYGVGRTSRALVVGIVALVTVFLAVVGFVTYRLATNGVQSTLLRFTVVSDTRVDVTFDVRRDEVSDTVCVLRAQNEKHADVGYATVRITRGRTYVQPTYSLATYARATTAEVLGCSPNDPPRVDPPQFLPGTTNPPQVTTIDGS